MALFREYGDTLALSRAELGQFIANNSPVRLTDTQLQGLTEVLVCPFPLQFVITRLHGSCLISIAPERLRLIA
jgi:hypothetical protein